MTPWPSSSAAAARETPRERSSPTSTSTPISRPSARSSGSIRPTASSTCCRSSTRSATCCSGWESAGEWGWSAMSNPRSPEWSASSPSVTRPPCSFATPAFLHIYTHASAASSARCGWCSREPTSCPRRSRAPSRTPSDPPLEGYGVTECSPVIAVNALDFRAPGFYQPGSRRRTVGHTLAGVSVRISPAIASPAR